MKYFYITCIIYDKKFRLTRRVLAEGRDPSPQDIGNIC